MDHINCRVGRLPGKIVEIALNGDRTVKAALEAAELTADGYEIRVNAVKASPETTLQDGDTVLLVKQVKGN